MKCGDVQIKYKIDGDWELKKASEAASGYDLCSIREYEIPFNTPILVKTGLYLEIPPGFEGQVRSRSGLALKSGVFVLNSPGTIDADYRGEIGIILNNLKDTFTPFKINKGDRVAQLIICKLPNIALIKTTEFSKTIRQENGFGSTGINLI